MSEFKKKLLTSSEALRQINASSNGGFDYGHLIGFIGSQKIRTFVDFSGVLFESDFVGGKERDGDSVVKPHGRQRIINSFDLCLVQSYQRDNDMLELLVAGVDQDKPLLLSGAFFHREKQKWSDSMSLGEWGLSEKGFVNVFANSAGPLLKFDQMEIRSLWPTNEGGVSYESQISGEPPLITRSDSVREVILDILEQQPDIKAGEVWVELKNMAKRQDWPFLGVGDDDALKYEGNDGEKVNFLKRRNVMDRFNRIKRSIKTC